jgi:arsenate reductase
MDRNSGEDAPMEEITIMFLCRGNRCRSPLAEALALQLPRKDCRLVPVSAGLVPKDINPMIPEILEEIGLETPPLRSKSISEFKDRKFDYVISLCGEAEEDCPTMLGYRNLTIALPDPCKPKRYKIHCSEKERFRRVRDALRAVLVAWFGPEE